jgi:ABC-type Zn uptake system ZnuABC Zn-binding protein ZnuA
MNTYTANPHRGAARLAAALLAAVAAAQDVEPLRACATTPDLASLLEAVGGDLVETTTFTKPTEDAHFVEARPSMVKALNRADLLVEVGLELEQAYLRVLVDNARNAAVLAGGPGRVDASTAIRKLGLPRSPVDRSMGDVHALGNPHYLLDPMRGLEVAALLRDALTRLRPAAKDRFDQGYADLRRRLAVACVGEELAGLYGDDVERLGLLFQHGKLAAFLDEHGDRDKLGGWFAALLPHRGAKVVADHDLWPYFAERFGIEVIGFFEPKPGIAPTTTHLEALIPRMKAESVGVILASPYMAPQHAEFVARKTGARIADMAHQTGARPGCGDYVATAEHNVRVLVSALAAQ